jgi:hypothetical protein
MAILLACGQLSARGDYRSEDRYNPQHISSLPPEIRNTVLHKCSTPKALHTVAIYFDNLKGVVLHFEHFLCDGDDPYCTVSGCLHQVRVSVRATIGFCEATMLRKEIEWSRTSIAWPLCATPNIFDFRRYRA